MNFKSLKWLNLTLTLIALIAIYIFLNDRLDPPLNGMLIAAFVILGLMSLIPVLRDIKNKDR